MHYALINHVSQRGGSSSLLHYTRRSGRYATDCASTPLTDTHARPLPGQPLHLLSGNTPLLLHYYGQLDTKAPGTSALTNHAVPALLYFWYRVCPLISGPRIAQFQFGGGGGRRFSTMDSVDLARSLIFTANIVISFKQNISKFSSQPFSMPPAVFRWKSDTFSQQV